VKLKKSCPCGALEEMGFEKGWETEFEDLLPKTPAGICCSCCSCTVSFILIILFFPMTITQLGQFKIGLVKNKVTGYVDLENSYTPGRYWIGFWKEFIEFPSTLNTIEFSQEQPEKGVQHLSVLRSRDKEGKQVLLDISIQYRLHKANLGKIYTEMMTGYEDIYISELRDALAKAANLFNVEDVWTDYDSVLNLMTTRCEEVLSRRFAECWGLQLWGVTLTSKFEAKLIETQVRKQAMQTQLETKTQQEIRSVTQVILAEYRKNLTIIKSEGDASVYKLENRAAATAEGREVEAQAKALQIVRDTVCPAYSRSELLSTCIAPWVMNADQLVAYQKQMLLSSHNESHFIYNMKGGDHLEAMNIVASRNIMNGFSRRLLDQETDLASDAQADLVQPELKPRGSSVHPAAQAKRILYLDEDTDDDVPSPTRGLKIKLGDHEL